MSNVAEGFARKGDREFARFLDAARGSAVEVVSLLYVAMDAGWIDKASGFRTPDSGHSTDA
jgi:four helix bundle protein